MPIKVNNFVTDQMPDPTIDWGKCQENDFFAIIWTSLRDAVKKAGIFYDKLSILIATYPPYLIMTYLFMT